MKKAHVSAAKKETVKQLLQHFQKYSVIGILNIENLPSTQLQAMRRKLRDTVNILIVKRRIILKAIEQNPQLEPLKPYLKRMVGLLFSTENPFTLYKTLKKNKSPAAAKPGQIAPKDILIKAGPTPFTPGPVISELSQLKIKAGVEAGKVAIKEDTIVCKEGQPIPGPLASILQRLGIEPIEIGLDLTAAYEKGTVYPKTVLDIDEEKFLNDLAIAATEALNLAIEAGFTTKETIQIMLAKASREAYALAREAKILVPELVEEYLGEAERAAIILSETVK